MPVPDPVKFFLEVAPYDSCEFGVGGFISVMKVQFFRGTLDTHCVECKRDSVFHPTGPFLTSNPYHSGPRTASRPSKPIDVDDLVGDQKRAVWPQELRSWEGPTACTLSEMEPFAMRNRVFQVRFNCTRNPEHSLYFLFRVHGWTITKIGQSPSLADLHLGKTKKYRKILGDEKYQEFTKAIGLNAHGVGIGSFVYLRRIFEDLIASARHEAAKSGTWDDDAYNRGRTDDRILLLQNLLPSFLVENRGIYSILSRGIHDLTEQECLNIFKPLKVGIELILDEKLEQQEKAAKIAQTKHALSKIKGELKAGPV